MNDVFLQILLSLTIALLIASVVMKLEGRIRKKKQKAIIKKGNESMTFTIIIKNNETGEELLREESNCILGVISNGEAVQDGNEGYQIGSLRMTKCGRDEMLMTVEALEKHLAECKEDIVKKFVEANPDHPISKLKELMEAIRREQKNGEGKED